MVPQFNKGKSCYKALSKKQSWFVVGQDESSRRCSHISVIFLFLQDVTIIISPSNKSYNLEITPCSPHIFFHLCTNTLLSAGVSYPRIKQLSCVTRVCRNTLDMQGFRSTATKYPQIKLYLMVCLTHTKSIWEVLQLSCRRWQILLILVRRQSSCKA